jgi:hypothetical protein
MMSMIRFCKWWIGSRSYEKGRMWRETQVLKKMRKRRKSRSTGSRWRLKAGGMGGSAREFWRRWRWSWRSTVCWDFSGRGSRVALGTTGIFNICWCEFVCSEEDCYPNKLIASKAWLTIHMAKIHWVLTYLKIRRSKDQINQRVKNPTIQIFHHSVIGSLNHLDIQSLNHSNIRNERESQKAIDAKENTKTSRHTGVQT